MAAKKKKVTLEVDAETLHRLLEAADALSEVATGLIWLVADPDEQAKLTKKASAIAKKRASAKRTKRRT